MSPISEEAGKVAGDVVEALKTQPGVLALVVFNLFYIGFSTFLQIKQGERFTDNQAIWERMTERALSSCSESKPR